MEAERWLRGGSALFDTHTEVSHRTIDDNVGNLPNQTITSGAGDLNLSAQSASWDVQTRANYVAMSEQRLAPTGNIVDVGEYNMTANYTGEDIMGGINLGHHDIGINSNLFSGFYRRGASAKVGRSDERFMATGFAFRPEEPDR